MPANPRSASVRHRAPQCDVQGDDLTYQWCRNGEPLAGASAKHARLAIDGPAVSDAGRYRVIVSNAGGECRSLEAIVSVRPSARRPTPRAPGSETSASLSLAQPSPRAPPSDSAVGWSANMPGTPRASVMDSVDHAYDASRSGTSQLTESNPVGDATREVSVAGGIAPGSPPGLSVSAADSSGKLEDPS